MNDNCESENINEILPYILEGKFFKVLQKRGKRVVALCTKCQKEVKGQTDSTGNFLLHLRQHVGLEEEFKNEKAKITKNDKRMKRAAPLNQRKMGDIFPKVQKTLMPKNERVQVKFVVRGFHSYSTVDEDGFQEMVTGLSDGKAQPITRRTLGRRTDVLLQEVIETMKQKYLGIKYFAIAADAWSTKGQKRSFLGSTLHWIDEETLCRASDCLSCRRFVGSHTYDKIATLLNDILQFYGIPVEKIEKATCDNGSNFLKAFRGFSATDEEQGESGEALENSEDEATDEEFEFQSIENIFASPSTNENNIKLPPCHRCTSHTLNLVCTCKKVCDRSNRLQRSAFTKCKGFWNAVSRSVKNNEAVVNECGCAVILPVPTRWNSLYDSISHLLKFETKLTSIFQIAGCVTLNTTEIQFLKEYKECTKPIAQALDRLQGDKGHPNMGCGSYYGVVMPTLITVEQSLQEINRTKPNMCDKLPSIILQQFTKRFEKYLNFAPEHDDAIIASVSHPYFKLRWVPTTKKSTIQDMFIKAVLKQASTDNIPESSSVSTTVNSKQHALDDEFFKFGSFGNDETCSLRNKIELECHRFLSNEVTSLDILHQFPFVKSTFIKYNTPLPSSGPVERIFNFSQMILHPKRQRLTDKNFEKSLILNVNSKLLD